MHTAHSKRQGSRNVSILNGHTLIPLTRADGGDGLARRDVGVQEGGALDRHLPLAVPQTPVRARDPGDDRQASGALMNPRMDIMYTSASPGLSPTSGISTNLC